MLQVGLAARIPKMGEGALCFAVGSAKKPGEWKDQVNQAGATVFVLPELVPGTLREAFERIQALADPRGTRADDDVRRERSASLHGRQRQAARRPDVADSAAEHFAIIDCIHARDGDGAEAAMREHLRRAKDRTFELMRL